MTKVTLIQKKNIKYKKNPNWHLSYDTSQLSAVRCQVSAVCCNLSTVTCHFSPVIYFYFLMVMSVPASFWKGAAQFEEFCFRLLINIFVGHMCFYNYFQCLIRFLTVSPILERRSVVLLLLLHHANATTPWFWKGLE